MEHAQRGKHVVRYYVVYNGLNPYFNGTCSKRLAFVGVGDYLVTS